MKYGLWEEGKRTEWFDEDQIKQIMQGKLDYKVFFKRTESGFNVDSFATFDIPSGFNERV